MLLINLLGPANTMWAEMGNIVLSITSIPPDSANITRHLMCFLLLSYLYVGGLFSAILDLERSNTVYLCAGSVHIQKHKSFAKYTLAYYNKHTFIMNPKAFFLKPSKCPCCLLPI